MASGISSPLGIAGVLLIIIGIIMAVVGVILLIANQNRPKAWYIWLLLIGGVVMGIVGGIMLAIALSQKTACCPTQQAVVPSAITTMQTQTVGQNMFDPDPKESYYTTQGAPQHVVASGPYGPGGTQTTVSGVYTPPPLRNYVTSDILPHAVVPLNQ